MLQLNKSAVKGIVFNIQKFSLHDGPGIRTTIFLKGCPLSCIWCFNPESQNSIREIGFNEQKCIDCRRCYTACESNALILKKNKRFFYKKKCNLCGKCINNCPTNALVMFGKEYSVEEIIKEIKKDIHFYKGSSGGVTLSGGEPFMQPRFALEILKKCKRTNIHTAVETCGYTNWRNIKEISKYLDLFLFDLKTMDSEKHKEATGKSNKLILDNLVKLSGLDKPIVIRIPLIPDFNNNAYNMERTAKFLKKLNNIKYVELMPYRRLGINKYKMLNREYGLNYVKTPSEEKIKYFYNIFTSNGIEVAEY